MVVRLVAVMGALLASGVSGGIVGAKPMSGKFGSGGSEERPVTKVINLLKDMQAEVEKEGEEEQEIYDKQACWCETNDKEKKKSIADAEHHIKELNSQIEELTAQSSQLNIDIPSLETSIMKGKKSLAEAAEVRDKELAEFNKEDKDAIVSIGGMKSAVQTLSKHNAGAALTQEVMLQVKNVVSHHMVMSQAQLRTLGLAPQQKRFVASFLQEGATASSLSAGSGEIFGVLQAMKESFETNMASARKEEARAAEEFATMKQAKEEEITAGTTQKERKESELASIDEDNANAKADLKDTEEALEADRVFHKDVKTRCAGIDEEWAARQRMRQDEVSAISEALKILTDDDARDLVGRTTNFVQYLMRSSSMKSSDRNRAKSVLQKAAKRLDSPGLSMLVTRMQGSGFDSVIADIEEMVAKLEQEGKDEVKHKDYCVEELHQNELDVDEKYHEQSNLKTKEADLESSIKGMTEDIKKAKSEIADTQIELRKAAEIREEESKGFETAIADQRATKDILNKVITRLNEFYNKKAASALLQVSSTKRSGQEPDGFQKYQKNDGAKGQGWGVVSMIKAIIKDSSKVIMTSTVNNNNAQLAYEEFAREGNKSIKMLRKEIVDKTNRISMDEATLARVKADLEGNLQDLEAISELNQQIHVDCDFVVQNFRQRQDARTNEIDALIEAKKMMSGH